MKRGEPRLLEQGPGAYRRATSPGSRKESFVHRIRAERHSQVRSEAFRVSSTGPLGNQSKPWVSGAGTGHTGGREGISLSV